MPSARTPGGRTGRGPRARGLVVVAVASAALLAGCGSASGGSDSAVSGFSQHDPDGLHAVVLPTPYQLPDATLTDSAGSAYSLRSDTTAPLTLFFFGYTRCPDICQVVMADITAAVRRLPDAERADVGMLLVTSDPARDDPATLRRYLDRFDPHFVGLTGPLPRIEQVAHALGVTIEKGEALASGGYAVAHGTQVVGVLPDGTAPLVWTQGTTSAQLAEDIETVLADGVPEVTAAPDAGAAP